MHAAPTAEAVETAADRPDLQETDEVADASDIVADEVLVEEISIDGMCGVY